MSSTFHAGTGKYHHVGRRSTRDLEQGSDWRVSNNFIPAVENPNPFGIGLSYAIVECSRDAIGGKTVVDQRSRFSLDVSFNFGCDRRVATIDDELPNLD